MVLFKKKTSPRRDRVRKRLAANRFSRLSKLANADVFASAMLWLLYAVVCVLILSLDLIRRKTYAEVLSVAVLTVLVSVAGVFYIRHYQKRIIRNPIRALALVGLFLLLLATTKVAVSLTGDLWWATGTAVTAAIILVIAYSQRFALGMSLFYCVFASFAAGPTADFNLFLTMAAGAVTCCFCLKEIRTRMKLLKVSTSAAVIVFATAFAGQFLAGAAAEQSVPQLPRMMDMVRFAGFHAGITLVVGMLIQSLLPLIEKIFRIATSMTLLDYSDANQPLLKRLAMETPGTYSHSLLIGSVAEAAAEAISRNGLLCRVGAYYHDIGKINKPNYFVENEMGSLSRHKELSPAMSQLIIVGHVKDGIEMAKEYGLPAVLRQFIETHHGTTVVEYFYNEAKKKHEEQQAQSGSNGKRAIRSSPPPAESEFRYAGPKPRTKEAAIVMLADTVEGAVRSLSEVTPTKIEAVVRNMAMKRLQDGQFDECDLSLRELSKIETSISKTLAAHYHARIAYPKPPDVPEGPGQKDTKPQAAEKAPAHSEQVEQKSQR